MKNFQMFGRLVAVVSMTVVSSAAPSFAAPLPEKPGRPTPSQAGIPTQSPATQPLQPTNGNAQAGPSSSDDDFLKETAGDLDVPAKPPMDARIQNLFGLRNKLEDDGITFSAALTADYSKNLTGGITTHGDAFRQLFDFRLNLDSKPILGFDNGTFSIDFQNQAGQNGSDRLTGDVQGFDNADSDGRTEISELWYQQLLADGVIRLKIGKVDANSEFAAAALATGFLNSSFGYSPTIFLMPTYPDPAMSVNAFIYPAPWFYAGAGVYDGSGARGVATGSYGPKNFFDGDGSYFSIGEVGVRWAPALATLPGRVAIGGWYSTADLTKFDGSNQSGTGGFYALAEQTLWHKSYYNPGDPVGIAAFVQYGYANPHLSDVMNHVGGGVVWTGIIDTPARQNDALGAGFSYAGLTRDPNAGFAHQEELALETYYGLQLTPYLLIKPDLQYIIHPGGTDEKNALAATLRVTLAF